LELYDIAARLLTAAISGISATRISESSLRNEEVNAILRLLVKEKLIEAGESSVYWITKEGIKFLELRFNMERMLKVQASLI
jgi:predicted transcriptional regulator